MGKLYPLKFKPILKSLVWGGDKIAAYKGIQTELRNIGESWELSGVEDDESIVADGPLAGVPINELVRKYKGELLGERVYAESGGEFPLLIKFIDARADLSVQVHPDDELAAKKHNGLKGKTEMWYVASADKGAHLMSGLNRKISQKEYEAMVKDNTITDALCDYLVNEGDVFFLPAGRIHSIGAGCFITEIQQTSDLTYRIYDFGRVGLDGKPRELHTELAKDAIDYTVSDDYRTHYDQRRNEEMELVRCRYFHTSLYDLDGPLHKNISELDSFVIVICVGGSARLVDDNGNEVIVRQGETILVPSNAGRLSVYPASRVKLLMTNM